jgi:hypothetical protein
MYYLHFKNKVCYSKHKKVFTPKFLTSVKSFKNNYTPGMVVHAYIPSI